MKIPFRPLLAGALMFAAFWTSTPSYSQALNPAQSITEVPNGKGYELALKNVSPRIIAWWLDPAHQPRPTEFGGPEEKQQLVGTQKNVGVFALPTGIESIAPLDAKNSLLVIGTREAVQELSNTVAFLDKPIRQIEIEAHVVPLTREEMKNLGLDFAQIRANTTNPTDDRPQFSLSFPNNTLSTLLATRTPTGPLAEVKVPRVLAINNLTASVTAFRSYPVPAEVQDKIATLLSQNPINAPLELQTPLQINFTPTINNDDTVTVLMDIKGQLQLGRKGDTMGLALSEPASVTSIANVKDGQTIALGGFDHNFTSAFLGRTFASKVPLLGDLPLVGNPFRSRSNSSTQLVVFLSPRIVRR